MATNKQMREELDRLTSEYLGFTTTCGLPKSAPHALLERRLQVYRRMVEHQREYLRLQSSYTNEEILAFGLGFNSPKDLEVARLHRRSANFAWSNPNAAAEVLRIHGDF